MFLLGLLVSQGTVLRRSSLILPCYRFVFDKSSLSFSWGGGGGVRINQKEVKEFDVLDEITHSSMTTCQVGKPRSSIIYLKQLVQPHW